MSLNKMQIHFSSVTELAQIGTSKWSYDQPLFVIPFTNSTMLRQSADLMAQRAEAPGHILAIFDDLNWGFIRIVNAVFRLSHSPLFGYVAQDAFAGRAWLRFAMDALGREHHFLGFNDGKWAGGIASFGLARRSWANSNYGGDFFCPQYHRHYADAELTLLALQQGVYVYDANSVLIEIDWEKDRKKVDEKDRKIFLERRGHGFDGKVSNSNLLNMIK
jgi:hypothetical protein